MARPGVADTGAERVKSAADEPAEIHVRMLPLHRAEIFLRLVVVALQCDADPGVSAPGEDIGRNGAVEFHSSDQFVIVADGGHLGGHILGQALGDPHRLGQILVEGIIFDCYLRRKNIRSLHFIDQSGNPVVHGEFLLFGIPF